MKKFTKIALIGAIGLLFAGCSSSPEDAVDGFLKSMKNGDFAKTRSYCTEKLADSIDVYTKLRCRISKKEFKNDDEWMGACIKENAKFIDIKKTELKKKTDTTAEVEVTESIDGKEISEVFTLVKVDGDWKVER